MLKKIGRKGNPVGPIVLLKKHRPAEYMEKQISISASFTTELPAEDGKALLLAMFGQGVTSTYPAAEAAGALSAHVGEGAPSGTGSD